MLFGLSCNHPLSTLQHDSILSNLPTAIQELAFVGINEEWENSIRLFHSKFGGDLKDSELGNVRKTSSMKPRKGGTDAPAFCKMKAGSDADILDDKLHKLVQNRFTRELHFFNISS